MQFSTWCEAASLCRLKGRVYFHFDHLVSVSDAVYCASKKHPRECQRDRAGFREAGAPGAARLRGSPGVPARAAAPTLARPDAAAPADLANRPPRPELLNHGGDRLITVGSVYGHL